tara:strand:+ start:2279 stop:2953 length:675 start_codon:yes stop_codon:yes gene_type:complete
MIYAKHNFAENFMNADGETFSLDRDMIISELARVINANPVGVKDAIFDCGINIDPQADKFEISEVMSGNMANNDCLQRSIGHLVLDNNVGWKDMLSFAKGDDEDYSNAKGDGWKSFWKGTKDVVGSEQFAQVLGVTIGSIYTAKQQNKQYEQSEKIRQHELELAKINSEAINNQLGMGSMYGGAPGGAPQGGMSMGAKIGIGVGAVAVLGVIIWAIVSASKNKS